MTATLNREQRRAAMKPKKPKPQRHIAYSASTCLLDWARPFEPNEMLKEHNLTWAAFGRLKDGAGTEQDFNRVSMRLNIVRIRAEEIDPSLAVTICAGQEAMFRMRERYTRGLAFGLDADGLACIPVALELQDTITNASSPLQMHEAMRTVYRAFKIGTTHSKQGFLCPI